TQRVHRAAREEGSACFKATLLASLARSTYEAPSCLQAARSKPLCESSARAKCAAQRVSLAMAFCRNDPRRPVWQFAALCALTVTTCASCSLDSSPTAPGPNEPPPVASTKSTAPTAREAPGSALELDGSVRDADIKVSTG